MAEEAGHLEWGYLAWDLSDAAEEEKANNHFSSLERSICDGTHHPDTLRLCDPVSWSPGYKLYLGILGSIANFSTTYAGGSYTSATNAMANEWHVSTTAVLIGVTVYTIAFGLAPMFLAPLSELTGKRPIVTASGIAFVLGVLFCAVTQLYVGMLLARVVVGIASSTFAVIIVGVVADIYPDAKDRFATLTLFTAGAMFGNGFGPLVSGPIVQNTSWRWLFGALGLFVFAMVVVVILSFKETRAPVLLSKKAKALNKWYDSVKHLYASEHWPVPEHPSKTGQTQGLQLVGEWDLSGSIRGDNPPMREDAEQSLASEIADTKRPELSSSVRWKVKADEERGTLAQMIKISLTRPLHLLLTEPVVFWFSCWAAFAWSIMYALLVVVPYTFQTVYGFDLQTSSAISAAMCIASILMAVLTGFHDRITALVLSKEKLNSPEAVLYPVAVEAIFLPIGLFWYGWAAEARTHWIVPTLGLGCATMGMFSVYLAVFAYLSSAYKQYASSANAAQSMLRNLMGGTFPLFSRVMFQRLGFGGACSLLGRVGILLTAVPWVLIAFGPQIRAGSKYAFREGP